MTFDDVDAENRFTLKIHDQLQSTVVQYVLNKALTSSMDFGFRSIWMKTAAPGIESTTPWPEAQ